MNFDIIVVGCGGTGSHYIKELGRYLFGKKIGPKKQFRIILVDGDIVEEKNLQRQAFLSIDVGCNKAKAMAEILNQAYGLEMEYYDQYIDAPEDLEKLVRKGAIPVLIGCVDNHQCRQSMHYFYESKSYCIYMDSANEYQCGEVVIGTKIGDVEVYPDRVQYFPEILTENGVKRSEESCEVLNNSAPQHLLTNQFAALILLRNTIRLFDKEWPGGIYFFDMSKCYSQDRTPRRDENEHKRSITDFG